jgi:hypothetical protein
MAYNMTCYNSRMADQYAHDSGLESESDIAYERTFDDIFDGLPCPIRNVIDKWILESSAFDAAITEAVLKVMGEEND